MGWKDSSQVDVWRLSGCSGLTSLLPLIIYRQIDVLGGRDLWDICTFRHPAPRGSLMSRVTDLIGNPLVDFRKSNLNKTINWRVSDRSRRRELRIRRVKRITLCEPPRGVWAAAFRLRPSFYTALHKAKVTILGLSVHLIIKSELK